MEYVHGSRRSDAEGFGSRLNLKGSKRMWIPVGDGRARALSSHRIQHKSCRLCR